MLHADPAAIRRRSPLCLALVLCCLALPGAGEALETERVVIVVIDGPRDTEFFDDPQHQWIPRIWNELRPQGYVSHRFWNGGHTETVSGHASILTGFYQTLPNDGSQRPTGPLLWEYLRDQRPVSDTQCLLVIAKSKLLKLSWSLAGGYGPADSARVIGPTWNDEHSVNHFKTYARQHQPILSMISLAEVDGGGHSGDWDRYTGAIRKADSLTAVVWNWLQAEPGFAGKTSMFVTSDHGRHRDDWENHGDGCTGCRHVPFLALGPDFVTGVETYAPQANLGDICGTAAVLLDIDAPGAQGRILWEIFAVPSQIAAHESSANLRLVVAPSPARHRIRVEVAGNTPGPLSDGWEAALFDAGGRKLWCGEFSTGEIGSGVFLDRPASWRGSGSLWLELRSVPGGVRLATPVRWVR